MYVYTYIHIYIYIYIHIHLAILGRCVRWAAGGRPALRPPIGDQKTAPTANLRT